MEAKQLALRKITTRKGGSFDGTVALAALERSSLATASFRVYYSLRAGAVPFLWESKPGTPKSCGGDGAGARAASVLPSEMAGADADADAGLQVRPISPPPSYHSSQLKGGRRCRARSSWPAVGLLRALLGALGIRRRPRGSPASRI